MERLKYFFEDWAIYEANILSVWKFNDYILAQYIYLYHLHVPDPLRLPPTPLCDSALAPRNTGSSPAPRHSAESGESIRPSARHRGDSCASSPSRISDPACQSDVRYALRQYSVPLSPPDEPLPGPSPVSCEVVHLWLD